MLCCGYTLTDFFISIRLTSLALWQSNDCPSASKATLMNMDKYFMWIHYELLHNHNKAKHNKPCAYFLGYTVWSQQSWQWAEQISGHCFEISCYRKVNALVSFSKHWKTITATKQIVNIYISCLCINVKLNMIKHAVTDDNEIIDCPILPSKQNTDKAYSCVHYYWILELNFFFIELHRWWPTVWFNKVLLDIGIQNHSPENILSNILKEIIFLLEHIKWVHLLSSSIGS